MSSRLLKSTGVFGAMTLVSRVLGFVRDTLQAAFFGAGIAADAYLVAYKIPNFLRRLFAEGAFSQAFVPVLSQTKTVSGHEETQQLIDVVSGTLAGVLLIVSVIGVLAAPIVLALFAPGFGSIPEKYALGVHLLRITFPYIFFISLTALAASVLNTYGRFGQAAFNPALMNLVLIGAMLIFAPNIVAQAWAILLAGVVQLVFLLPSLKKLGLAPRPRFSFRDARVRRVVGLMLPILFGSSVAQISLLLDTILASFLVTGSVSWLYYADRLMEFPLGLFSVAIGTVILPSLAAQHAVKSAQDFSATLDWGLRMILLVGVPSALGLLLLAEPLTCTLFEYKRFTAHDTHMTGWALMAYALGFLGFSLVKVLIPGFYARQETRLPVRYGVIALCCGMAMNVTFMLSLRALGFEAPHVGIALGTSLNGCINAALLFRRLRHDRIYLPAADWGAFGLRLLLANAALALTAWWLAGDMSHWHASSAFARVLRLAGTIGLAAGIYFAVLWLAGLRPAHLKPAHGPAHV